MVRQTIRFVFHPIPKKKMSTIQLIQSKFIRKQEVYKRRNLLKHVVFYDHISRFLCMYNSHSTREKAGKRTNVIDKYIVSNLIEHLLSLNDQQCMS